MRIGVVTQVLAGVMVALMLFIPAQTTGAASIGVDDRAGVLTPAVIQTLAARQAELQRQNGIQFRTVITADGSLKGAAMSAMEKPPCIVLAIDTSKGEAGWFTTGVTGPDPTKTLNSRWIREGYRIGNWNDAIASAHAYAIDYAGQAKLPFIKTNPDPNWMLIVAMGAALVAGSFALLFNLRRRRRKKTTVIPEV